MTAKKSAENVAQTELVESLADIAKRLDLSEIEYQLGELKIRVARQMATTMVQMAAPAPSGAPAAAPVAVAAPEAMAEHPGTVKSPMVGTAYLRPAPESPSPSSRSAPL